MARKICTLGLLVLIICALSPRLQASTMTSRTLADAAESLTKRVVKSVKPKGGTFGRTAVFVTLTGPIEPELKTYIHKLLEERLKKAHKGEVVQCFRCETITAESDGNRIIVEKGLASNKAASDIARGLSLDTFLMVDVSYAGSKLVMQVKAVEPNKNEIIYDKRYQMHSRFLSDKNFMFGLDLGTAYLPNADSTENKEGASIAAFIGERFYGFGKVGFGISSVFSVTDFAFSNSTGPYISANINELSGFSMPWGSFSVFANPGYAVSQKTISFVIRGGVELELENFVHFTAEYQQSLYSQNPTKKYPSAAVLSVGFDLY